MKDNTRREDNTEVAVMLPLSTVTFIHDQCEEAASIMEGFLSRFEEPSCKEQQEVVDRAKKWAGQFRSSEKTAKQVAAMMKSENN